MFFSAICRRAVLPVAAVALGAMLIPADTHFLFDGECRSFAGSLSGNDPDGRAHLRLCRTGDTVSGAMSVYGQAGKAVARLSGDIDAADRLILDDQGAALDAPNAGWMFCFDDTYYLAWHEKTETLVGSYRSTQCNDIGVVSLRPTTEGAFENVPLLPVIAPALVVPKGDTRVRGCG